MQACTRLITQWSLVCIIESSDTFGAQHMTCTIILVKIEKTQPVALVQKSPSSFLSRQRRERGDDLHYDAGYTGTSGTTVI